ncbi:MAG: SDR family NAD(P)-dependent oxidoreductase [Thermoplasmata archaeon]|nr:SDR family NAD(P)-dependent oxidoreductase [Thermoplasmata archaeon]
MNDIVGRPENVVVLGGGSDLALAVLRRMAASPLQKVTLAGRDLPALEAIGDELLRLGIGRVDVVYFDARAIAGHDHFAEKIAENGPIDLLLVAAGVLDTGDLELLDAARVAGAIETNFSGLAAAMVAFAKIMRRAGHGQLVVFSSVAGIRVRRSNFVYGAAKAGLDGFSQGLGDLLAGSGVRVMVVRPGFVQTKMTAGRPRPPFTVTEADVAAAVVRGLERQAEIVWVPSILRIVLRVAQLVPRRIWRVLPL